MSTGENGSTEKRGKTVRTEPERKMKSGRAGKRCHSQIDAHLPEVLNWGCWGVIGASIKRKWFVQPNIFLVQNGMPDTPE